MLSSIAIENVVFLGFCINVSLTSDANISILRLFVSSDKGILVNISTLSGQSTLAVSTKHSFMTSELDEVHFILV